MISILLITGVKPRTLMLMKNKSNKKKTKKIVVLQVKTSKRHLLLLLIKYELGNHNLLSVASASQNDLGIIATNNLNWKMHINQMICKAIFCNNATM